MQKAALVTGRLLGHRQLTNTILRVMQLSAALILGFCLQVAASGYTQTITWSARDANLQQVFTEIKKQTGYVVVGDYSLIKKSKPVTVSVVNKPLKDFLEEVLQDQNVKYTIKNTTISIKENIENLSVPLVSPSLDSPPITIKGRVINEKGDPVIASVVVKGTKNGTTTNNAGEFVINNVDDNAILIISGIGIETSEIKVAGRSEINVATRMKIAEEEVVVKTNYYSTTKRLSTGNISKVTSKEIGDQPVVSPLLALQGRVPGLEITMPANATPGVAPTIRIRGNNSLQMSKRYSNTPTEDDGNYPLYVIDGVPVNSSPLKTNSIGLTAGGYDPLSTINPSNIESIEILKDADATAIYGSRGANGVILVTTKQAGKSSERTNLEFSVYKGSGKVSKKLHLLNTEQYLAMRGEGLANDGATINNSFDTDLTYWDKTQYTDWQEVLLGESAEITDLQGNISFGNKNTSFRVGGGFYKQTLIFSNDFGYSRFSGQASINHNSINQRFKMSFNANYGVDNNILFSDADVMNDALRLPPHAPKLYNDDGTLNWEIHTIQGIPSSTWKNPLASRENKQKIISQNLVTSANISYELISGLSFMTSIGYTNLTSNERVILPLSGLSPVATNVTGSIYFIDARRNSWIIEPKLSYSKKKGNHNFNIIVGTTWQKRTTNLLTISADGYTSDALLGSLKAAGPGNIFLTNDNVIIYKYASVYGRIGYNWNQKYLLNLTGRRDGSSRFGPDKRFGNFGAVGAGWNFSEEAFLQKIAPILTFGKLRASYGITGNDAVGDYAYYNLYDILTSEYSYDGVQSIVPSSLYNSDFAWEATKKLELGLEMSFFNGQFGLEVNWYRNVSSNQLVQYPVPYTSGFTSVLTNFDATVINTGFEGVLNVKLLSSKKWRWNVSLNISVPDNKLVKFDGIESSPYVNQYKVGEPLSIQWLYVWDGINQQTGLYQFVDQNKDGKITDLDRQLMNPMERIYYGGLNNTFQYKSFELSIQFQFSKQPGFRYMPVMPGYAGWNQSVDVLNRWFVPGDQTDIQRFASSLNSLGGTSDAALAYIKAQQSTYNIQDASFIRLKSLSISYLFNSYLLQKIKLQQVRLFIQGQDLLTITQYKGLDPETGNGLPPLRMITAGIQLRL